MNKLESHAVQTVKIHHLSSTITSVLDMLLTNLLVMKSKDTCIVAVHVLDI